MNLDNQNLAQVSQELTTIRDYIRWGCSRFSAANLHYGHGTDNAWDEAAQIVLSTLHLETNFTNDMLNATLTLVERRQICELIFRRIQERIPAAYLTRQAWFAGMPFYIDERVIIPRSPIAELIENDFQPWLGDRQLERILDLCTGSGCIAIACAYAFAESKVDAVDISKDALEVAKINVEKHQVADQVNLLQSNLFENVTERYDLIVSNPPYVSHEEYHALPHEYSHEPLLALKAQEEGLELVRHILSQAADYLTPQGLLIVEVGNSAQTLTERFPKVPFTWLEFERGGDGVFLLTAHDLATHKNLFVNV